jgi:hydrogenase maturation protein HypF
LINCTNCGPRFSIITGFPYDRKNTTMASFAMCRECNTEYDDIADRRFHAQPVACNNCGPHYLMHIHGQVLTGMAQILDQTVYLMRKGGLIALKGTGGFHLMCDALNERAITAASAEKEEGKPLR